MLKIVQKQAKKKYTQKFKTLKSCEQKNRNKHNCEKLALTASQVSQPFSISACSLVLGYLLPGWQPITYQVGLHQVRSTTVWSPGCILLGYQQVEYQYEQRQPTNSSKIKLQTITYYSERINFDIYSHFNISIYKKATCV